MKHAAIFDLDGTLLDTLADIANSMNTVLENAGFPTHRLEDYTRFVGEGVRALIEKVLPNAHQHPQEVENLRLAFMAHYRENWHHQTRIFPGISELLRRLERHYDYFVFSNKPHDMTQAHIWRFFGKARFAHVLGASESVPHKPNPAGVHWLMKTYGLSAERCWFIGDTSTDMETACAAGIPGLGVTWGFRDRVELQTFGAAEVFDDALSLESFLADAAGGVG
jgi:phosphoglycolate phosphatase